MLNPFKEVDWNPDLPARRKFAISLVIGFPIIALVILLAGRAFGGEWKPLAPMWMAGCGAGIGLMLWALPRIAKPFYIIWYTFGCAMGIVIGNVLISAFYFLIITPFGLGRRLSKRKPIAKAADPDAKSYWRDAPPNDDPKRYFRQY